MWDRQMFLEIFAKMTQILYYHPYFVDMHLCTTLGAPQNMGNNIKSGSFYKTLQEHFSMPHILCCKQFNFCYFIYLFDYGGQKSSWSRGFGHLGG